MEWWRRNCIGAGRVGDDRVGVVGGRGVEVSVVLLWVVVELVFVSVRC